MTATQLPGQTLQPIPDDSDLSLLQKQVENSFAWAATKGKTGVHADWLDGEFALHSKLVTNLFLIASP